MVPRKSDGFLSIPAFLPSLSLAAKIRTKYLCDLVGCGGIFTGTLTKRNYTGSLEWDEPLKGALTGTGKSLWKFGLVTP